MLKATRVFTYDNGVGALVEPPEVLEPPKEFESKKKLDEWKNQLMLERSISDGESRTVYLEYKEIK